MFAWEKTLLNDFYNLFGLEKIESINVFHDDVITGNDVRILKNTNGETILLYSLIDKGRVVITTNEDTFNKILLGLDK
jgi:hypothetical protein